MPRELEEAQREDLRRRLASNIAVILQNRNGHHVQMSDSEALASDIERSAFEVAQRQPEGQRAGTYAKVASRLLINAVLKQEEAQTVSTSSAAPDMPAQDQPSWSEQELASDEGTETVSMQPSSSGSTSNDRRSPSSLAASQQESEAFPVLEGTLDSPLRQNLSQHFSAPPFLSSQERRCINREMSLSLRKQQVRDIFSTFAAHTKERRPQAWGWLEPGTASLPHVLLMGEEVALGRSSGEAEGSRAEPARAAMSSPSVQNSNTAGPVTSPGTPSVQLLNFVEVSDGRVSRLHCVFRQEPSSADSDTRQPMAEPDCEASTSAVYADGPKVLLMDCSTNGTFVNGAMASSQGLGTPLQDGDRVSLVLSVTPLIEQYFIFHAGEPEDRDKRQWAPISSMPCLPSEEKQMLASPAATKLRMRSLQRMTTSKYTTADVSTLEDFQCQICLGTLRSCVALEPCGHNFCAPCLSHHFASQLLTSNTLTCPLRCVAPSKVVANAAVRALIHRLRPVPADKAARAKPATSRAAAPPPQRAAEQMHEEEEEEEEEEEVGIQMSQLCPLGDDVLPISATGLRMKQVVALLRQVDSSDRETELLITSLEALAKLAWNDDEVRREIADRKGVATIVNAMTRWPLSGGVQCNGCLAIVSLVRSESEVCQANQWRVARAGGLESIVAAMRGFREYPMVQLCALLCMVPLALENTILQAHLAALGLPDIFTALAMHPDQVDLQAKGLVALGVLGQGEQLMHDSIRASQLRLGAAHAIARALQRHGRANEEVLWAALFALAVLVREGSAPNSLALRSIAATGMLPLLQSCMAAYEAKAAQRQEEGDEMIISAGNFLIRALRPAASRLRWERIALVTLTGAALGVVAWRCRGLVLGKSSIE